jgi:transposase
MPSPPLPGLRRRWWAMTDRLNEVTRRRLAEDRQAGMTQEALAQKYAISLSSVQRLLRTFDERGA